MPGNDHDLIMQFARGTDALALVDMLSKLQEQYERRKITHTSAYDQAMNHLFRDYYGQVEGAIRQTRNRLMDLQPAEIESSDDDDDDD